jgi:multiple sugar transport system substrate-binding protein
MMFLFLTALFACSDRNKNNIKQPTDSKTITILWSDWLPSKLLKILCEEFTRETGVQVVVETFPFDQWQAIAFSELDKHGTKYDLVIGDSQWLGKGAVEGHYVDLTKWIREQGINKNLTEAALSGYAEYPKGSMKYWAIPLQGDAMGMAYRKDLFEDPAEQVAFLEKYGYPLAVPDSWEQLHDIAEFFNRPEEGLHGIGIGTSPDYDGITMGFENVLFAWGGEWGNSQYKVKEFLNSQEAVDALKFYHSLYKLSPPGWESVFWDDMNKAMIEGKIAMGMNYFSFFPDLVDPAKNPLAGSIGFFPMPKGPTRLRASALGGMGISLISYSKNKEYALNFLKWLFDNETQLKWSKLGGFTCNKQILSSPEFLNAAPFNTAFMESITVVKDFWVVPQYSELLDISQKYLHEFVVEEKYTAEETLNYMATEMEAIFDSAGYYKE